MLLSYQAKSVVQFEGQKLFLSFDSTLRGHQPEILNLFDQTTGHNTMHHTALQSP